jgi:hypothetical protein
LIYEIDWKVRDWERSVEIIEFIPIKPWVAMALNGHESYATHNRLP